MAWKHSLFKDNVTDLDTQTKDTYFHCLLTSMFPLCSKNPDEKRRVGCDSSHMLGYKNVPDFCFMKSAESLLQRLCLSEPEHI